MAKTKKSAYGLGKPLRKYSPFPIEASRAPTSSDVRYDIGQVWVNTSTSLTYILASISAGSATWGLASPGASDIDTINSLPPTAGNIIIDGGTNITDANAGSTVTLNLDDAIVLATSVTTPLVTAAAATDIQITAPTGQDCIVKLGDNAAANKFSILDSDDAEIFAVDSNGGQTFAGLTLAGAFVSNGGTVTLGSDNAANAIIVGGGTTARAITIGQDAAAHTVAIGQAAAGAITIDTAAGVSIDGATASNWTLSGAGEDLTLESTAGRVIVNGEEAATNAITLLSAAGGIDVNAALEINIDSSEAAVADAIRIVASAADGGIDCDSGTGGTTIDSTGAISIDAAAASNYSVSGAGIDLSLLSAAGRVIVNGEEAAVSAVELVSAAGGISASSALQLSLISSEAAVADSVRIQASAADGGIDCDAGTGGIAIDSTGAISIDGAASSNLSVSGAGVDVSVLSAAGRAIIGGEEAVDNAITLVSAAGGIDADCALQLALTSSENTADSIKVESTAGGIDILASGAAAGEDIDIVSTGSSVNITATESVGDAIVIDASGAAGAIQLNSGTGGCVLGSGQTVNVVSKANGDTPYTLLGSDYVVAGDTGAGVLAVTLPAAPATGRVVIVTDEGGAAGATNITVNGNGKNISAAGSLAATAVINSNYGSMYLIYTGTIWSAFDIA